MKFNNKIIYALAGLVLLAGACEDGDTIYVEPETGEVSRLTVSPVSVTMGYADDVEFFVGVRPVSTEVSWESSDPNIAYVDENNHIVVNRIGEVELTAKAGNFSQTVPVTINSSVKINNSLLYMDEGTSSDMSFVEVLPEGTEFTVTAADENVISVPDEKKLAFKAIGGGITTVTVTAEDGIKGSFTVGVASAGNTIAASTLSAELYEGSYLNHSDYDIVAVALQPSGVSYDGGGSWTTGDGTGVFLKLFKDASVSSLPKGEYTAGTGEYNFYATNTMSYVINGSSKTALTGGKFEITDSGINGYVTSSNTVYKLIYSGSVSVKNHEFEETTLTIEANNEWANGTNQLYYESTGTVWGGYDGTHQFKIANSASNTYFTLWAWPKEPDDPCDTYSFISGIYNGKGQIGNNTTYTKVRLGSTTNLTITTDSSITLSSFVVTSGAKNTRNSTVEISMSGTIYTNKTQSVSEINETQYIPVTINVNLNDLELTVTTSKLS